VLSTSTSPRSGNDALLDFVADRRWENRELRKEEPGQSEGPRLNERRGAMNMPTLLTISAPMVSMALHASAQRKYDPSFAVASATAYRDDVPEAEIHILEAGRFALDEATDGIASLVRDFLARLDGHKG